MAGTGNGDGTGATEVAYVAFEGRHPKRMPAFELLPFFAGGKGERGAASFRSCYAC